MRLTSSILILTLALLVMSGEPFAEEAAKTWGGDCWLPVLVPPATELTLSKIEGEDDLDLHFEVSDRFEIMETTLSGSVKPETVSSPVTLAEAVGRLVLKKGALLATTDQGGKFRLTPDDTFYLIPGRGTKVVFDDKIKLENNKMPPLMGQFRVAFDENTEITVILNNAAALRPQVSVKDDAWAGTVVRAETMPNVSPPDTLTVHLKQPWARFKDNIRLLAACVRVNQDTQAAPILEVKELRDGAADLTLSIPEKLRERWRTEGDVAVIVADGSFQGMDTFVINGWWLAAALAAVPILVMVFGLTRFYTDKPRVRFSWTRWFAGRGGKPSLSLFQVYLWTMVVLAGWVYVFVLTGQLFALSPQVMALLGIAGTGSVMAKFVAVSKGRQPEQSSSPKFSDMLKSNGQFDLYKLQLLLFTAFIAVYVSLRIFLDQLFPEIDQSAMLLLGISNGVYVGSKASGDESPIQRAARLEQQIKALELAKSQNETEKGKLENKVIEIEQKKKRNITQEDRDELDRDLHANENRLKLINERLEEVNKKLAESKNEFNAVMAETKLKK